jgi:hypothetical protein
MMLVPFADNANHFCVENYFELFNARLTKKALRKNQTFNNFEKCYFTKSKSKINFLKHFKEDEEPQNENKIKNDGTNHPQLPSFGCEKVYLEKNNDPGAIAHNSWHYYKKLKLRDEIEAIDPSNFVTG